MSCLCGSTYLPQNFTITINGQQYRFLHNEESFLSAGQIFSTISDKVQDSFNSLSINLPLILDDQIKLVLKTQSGDIVAFKYVGSFNKRTVLSRIDFQECELLLHTVNERLILQIYSICDESLPECCDKLPSFISISPTISSFCIIPYCYLSAIDNKKIITQNNEYLVTIQRCN